MVAQVLAHDIDEPEPRLLPHFFHIVGAVSKPSAGPGRVALVGGVQVAVQVHLSGQVPLVIGGAEQGAQAMLQAIEPRHGVPLARYVDSLPI
jgi:hypothetical protein